jgi:diacylglycerol kinase family enzyme
MAGFGAGEREDMASGTGGTVQLIYNASAGGHCSRRLAALRQGFETSGARVILCETGPGLAIEISEEASHVCAVGGDGTARHVALALARCGRPVPLSIYPGGSVNLIHREIASPLDPAAHAARSLGGTAVSPHYAGEINDTLFLACLSVGPDSAAVAAVTPGLKRRLGKFAYVATFLGILLRWQRPRIRLQCDGREIACEAFYVAKGRYFAGPWSFAPEARLAAPLLHGVALTTARRRDYARFVWALLRGKPVAGLAFVTAFTCTALSAAANEPLPVQADGDVVASLPAEIRLRADPFSFC